MKTRVCLISIVALLAALLCGAVPGQCRVIRVKPAGVDLNDGSTWAFAKKTLRAALTTAVSGDEIWVAAGTYLENVTLASGVGLYAGFAATESDRLQRDWRSNVTIIDAAASGSVVTSPVGVTASAVIDGFTIRNGRGTPRVVSGDTYYLGGGVLCTGSSPTIANNTVTANSASHFGGAMYLENSSPAISNNVITRNQAGWNGAGIHCENSSPAITNNFITENTITGTIFGGNQGGGIYCGASSSPAVTNNTIAYNSTAPTGAVFGGGICCNTSSSPVIANNIIDSNSSGVFSAGAPSLNHNCVHGNNLHDYVGLQAGDGDVSFDPAFVNPQAGNYHLQSGSRCIDIGSDAATQATWLDIDGQDRKYGSHVDIGADEFWPPPTVAITYPTSASTYDAIGPTLSLSGAASAGVVAVTWTNDRGGSGKCTGTATWNSSVIALQPGINVIIVTARDGAGFTSVDSLNVSYSTGQAASIYVKPSGSDLNTGESWALAKRTIQAGINAADSGEEIGHGDLSRGYHAERRRGGLWRVRGQ